MESKKEKNTAGAFFRLSVVTLVLLLIYLLFIRHADRHLCEAKLIRQKNNLRQALTVLGKFEEHFELNHEALQKIIQDRLKEHSLSGIRWIGYDPDIGFELESLESERPIRICGRRNNHQFVTDYICSENEATPALPCISAVDIE